MWTRFPHATSCAFVLTAVTVLAAGCVAPTATDTCFAPTAEGRMAYLIETQDGSARDVPATDATRWSLMVTCAEQRRPIGELAIQFQTAAHGALVAALDVELPDNGVLTLYAAVGAKDANGTSLFVEELDPDDTGAVYRLRIRDDDRSREGLDHRDLLELRYDAEGRRDFQSEFPIGTYSLTIRDSLGGEALANVTHRMFDPAVPRGDDTSGGAPPP